MRPPADRGPSFCPTAQLSAGRIDFPPATVYNGVQKAKPGKERSPLKNTRDKHFDYIYISVISKAVIALLFFLLGGFVVWNILFAPEEYGKASYNALLLTALGLSGGAALFLFWGRGKKALRARWACRSIPWNAVSWTGFFLLLLLCFWIRYGWILENPIDPAGDYQTFYIAADSLASQFDISGLASFLPRYMALFPHIFGYASFLSLIFSLFGSSPFAAAVTNVVLSTVSMALLYYLGLKLSGSFMAFAVSLFWTLCPSQILFNMFVLSEPYYTTLLLASMAGLLWAKGRLAPFRRWQAFLAGAPLGLVLALANSARPIAAIVVIAAAILLFVVEPLTQGAGAGKRFLLLLGLCLVYVAAGKGNDWLFTQRVGEAPASAPGYNICVGFNTRSHGKWNQEDSTLLTSYSGTEGLSARQVQEAMLQEAWGRITSGDIDFSDLFYHKLLVLWQTDDAPVTYGKTVLEDLEGLSSWCDGFYCLLWIFSLGGMWFLLRERGAPWLYLFPLFLLGLTMAQMLVEVAPRYHYGGIPCLAALAAYGAAGLARRSELRAEGLCLPSPFGRARHGTPREGGVLWKRIGQSGRR